jgi:hypothetical protein
LLTFLLPILIQGTMLVMQGTLLVMQGMLLVVVTQEELWIVRQGLSIKGKRT